MHLRLGHHLDLPAPGLEIVLLLRQFLDQVPPIGSMLVVVGQFAIAVREPFLRLVPEFSAEVLVLFYILQGGGFRDVDILRGYPELRQPVSDAATDPDGVYEDADGPILGWGGIP